MSQKNGFDIVLDVIGAFGRIAAENQRLERELQVRKVVGNKPIATDEDVDGLITAIKKMYFESDRREAIRGWLRYRTITVQQLSRLVAGVGNYFPTETVKLVVEEKGVSDPWNAHLIEVRSGFENGRCIRLIQNQGR